MIEFLGEVISWFGEPANWSGQNGLPNRLWEHVSISVVAIVLSSAIALPTAVGLGHIGRGGIVAVSAVNIGRAVPSFGLVALAFPITLSMGLTSPLGYWATLFALVALAMPPMFVNGYTAIRDVDPALVEAARGMGMTGSQVLRSVELPLGMPVVMAGVRVAAVQVVATATLGAVVGFGGLGRYIFDGFLNRDYVRLFVGGLMVAILAVGTELLLGAVERRTDRTGRRRQLGPVDDTDVAADVAPVS